VIELSSNFQSSYHCILLNKIFCNARKKLNLIELSSNFQSSYHCILLNKIFCNERQKLNLKKWKNYFNELCYGEVDEHRIELLMELILQKKLNGKNFSLCVDSFIKKSLFFLNFLDGSGTIPRSVEKSKMEFVNAVYYAGLIEVELNINVVTIITDRCRKIPLDQRRFTIKNNVDLCVMRTRRYGW
jgi:hypothetical protein